jgi:pimeloyl-ACP methyl ester carboxylesterase
MLEMPKIYRQAEIALEYELLPGNGPVVVFLPGFASDMGGTKAMFLRDECAARGQAMLRLDYSGHGQSGGKFIDGCIGDWAADAAAVIAAACEGRQLVLVGSSMGGWIALLLALQFSAQLAAMLLIAPAPDFTEVLLLPKLSDDHLALLARDGVIYPPSEYGEPIPLTQKLLEDGKNHLLLGGKIAVNCPVRVLHGMRDADVPWKHSVVLADCLESPDVRLIFVKDGDHRLSRAEDLLLLHDTLLAILPS